MHSISSLCLSLVQRVSAYVPRARLHTNMCVQSLNFHLFTWSSIFEGTGAIFFPAPHFRSLISSNFQCCTRHFEIRFHTPFYRRLILEFPNIWNNFFLSNECFLFGIVCSGQPWIPFIECEYIKPQTNW